MSEREIVVTHHFLGTCWAKLKELRKYQMQHDPVGVESTDEFERELRKILGIGAKEAASESACA